MLGEYREISNSVDGVSKAIGAAAATVAASACHQAAVRRAESVPDPVYLDLMTDEDVDELREVQRLGDDARACAERRVREGGDAVRGLYESFARNGLVLADHDGLPLAVTRWGAWAVVNRDRREALAAREREEQWAHDGKVARLSGLLGILGTVVGTVLGYALQFVRP